MDAIITLSQLYPAVFYSLVFFCKLNGWQFLERGDLPLAYYDGTQLAARVPKLF